MGVLWESSGGTEDGYALRGRRRRFRSGVAVLGAMATVVAGAALGAGTAAAATTTTFVTRADIAHACGETPTPTFCTDLSGTAGSANVQGTPTGLGYLDLKSPTTADKVQVFNTTHNGQRLDTISDLSYDSLVTHAGSIPGQAPTVQITINPHKAGITFATLVWEPIYTSTPSVDGMQEHFHPTASPSGQGGWATSKNAANLGQPGALGFNQYTASFADVLAAIPDATITTFSGLGVG